MTDEDIELAVDWAGDEGVFVQTLSAVGFLDGGEGSRLIHDWEEHNPWAAGSEKRSEKSRWAALCKRHGRAEAAQVMPEYAARLIGAGTGHGSGTTQTPEVAASGMPESANGIPVAVPVCANGMPLAGSGSAPSPSPSPIPSPSPSPIPLPSPIPDNTPPTPKGARVKVDPDEEPEGFGAWYAVYGRKDAKRDAIKAWRQLGPDEALQATMLAALRRWRWSDDRSKIPLPASWLRGRRWEDEAVRGSAFVATAGDAEWLAEAGFTHIAEAQNARCHIGNYREFRNGKRIPDGVPA